MSLVSVIATSGASAGVFLARRIADLGGTPLSLSSAAFAKFLADETDKWGKVVKFSGAKPD